ncbi:homeodomain-only protein-like [Babylonia areolata]|uniref:homeodomain-only protein-like n=1 Tax=Babylonia areolata TaxID=304850 RepID=UPI003FD3263F
MAGIQAHLSAPHQLPPLSLDQQEKLEENFRSNRNPSELDVVIIAAEVGLPEIVVKKWFQHRLACWRQKQGLPANQTSVND